MSTLRQDWIKSRVSKVARGERAVCDGGTFLLSFLQRGRSFAASICLKLYYMNKDNTYILLNVINTSNEVT